MAMPKWDFTKVKDKDQQEQLWIDEAAPVSVQSTVASGPKWDFTKTKSEPAMAEVSKFLLVSHDPMTPQTTQPVKTADTTAEQPQKNPLTQKLIDVVQREKDEKAAHQEMLRLWKEKKAFAAMKGEDPNKVAPPVIPEYLGRR